MRWTVGVLTGAAVLVLAAGCGTVTDSPDAAPPAAGTSGQPGAPQGGLPGGSGADNQPKNVNVAAALKTADKEFRLLKSGDWAGAWQLWTDTAKKDVPRDVFVAVNTACPAASRKDYQLQDVKPINNQLIELAFRRGGDTVLHAALRPGRSGWLFEPAGDVLVEYAGGADAAVSKRKAAKQC